jgi:hypothetical protein
MPAKTGTMKTASSIEAVGMFEARETVGLQLR